MKKIIVLVGTCLLLCGFVSLNSRAQDDDVMPVMPGKFLVYEEFVSPDREQAYRRVQAEAVEMWKEYNVDIPVYTYRTDDNSFYRAVPITSFASIDELGEKLAEILKKEAAGGGDPMQSVRDMYTTSHFIVQWSQELSYHPSGRFAQTARNPFIEWTFCYIRLGHEREAAEAIKKYIEFYNSIDESYEWDIYITLLGSDTPLWILMTRSESEMALTSLEHDLNSKYGEDFQKLWNNLVPHVRRFEVKQGWFLPDLSLLPAVQLTD